MRGEPPNNSRHRIAATLDFCYIRSAALWPLAVRGGVSPHIVDS